MLQQVPPTRTPERLAIKVKPAAERKLKQGHPWVYDGAIVKQNKPGKAGDLAIIFDQKHNKLLAVGLYDPDSPIRIKILEWQNPVSVGLEWWRQKVEQAYEKRSELLQTDTNSYRLIFGENDGFPGLVADVYAEVLVVKLYSQIWWPYLNDILPLLMEVSKCETMVLRLSRQLQSRADELDGLYDGQVLMGTLESPEIIFREHGLRFIANVIDGHKTGYFLDHRHNRKRVGELAKGKTVLDVFAYAGGFSVHALAGGATAVTSLDISAQALAMAQKNVALNPAMGEHQILVGDAFEGLEKLRQEGKRYDLIIIDPPSFAKREAEREKALEQYARLTKLGADLLQKNGILAMASCSSRVQADTFFELVEKTLQSTRRKFRFLEKSTHDTDHPVTFPEGAYLKCVYYQAL